MNTLISVLITVIIFGLVVIVHEFGHMYVAKKNGVIVEEFAVGMGPLLFSKKKDETLYTIRLFPIGGYCLMLGQDGENPEDGKLQEGSFLSKKVYQRMLIIVAGAAMNFILAFVLQFGLTSIDIVRLPIISEVTANSPAEEVGLEPGDRIIEFGGKKIKLFDEILFALMDSKNNPSEILYVKPTGQLVRDIITPKTELEVLGKPTIDAQTGEEAEEPRYIIGFTGRAKVGPLFQKTLPENLKEDYKDIEVISAGEYISYSVNQVIFNTKTIFYGLKSILSSSEPLDDLMGPVGLVGTVEETYVASKENGFFNVLRIMLNLTVLISANLGVVNLLPIPAVDGGRLIFLFIEALRGKPLDPDKEGLVHLIGIVAILLLGVAVAFNDVKRIFTR